MRVSYWKLIQKENKHTHNRKDGVFNMNKVLIMGRLVHEPNIHFSSGENQTAVARYTLAVDRRYKRQGEEQTADFISCVAFGRPAEFAQNYLHQATKILVTSRIQTGSYVNKDGQRIYTTDVVVEEQEFAESKTATENRGASMPSTNANPDSVASTANEAPAGIPDAVSYGYFN